MAALARHCLKASREGAFTTVAGRLLQGGGLVWPRKNECWYARIRDCRSISWNGCPLYPSAKCSGVQWVCAGDVYCVAGMSTSCCIILVGLLRRHQSIYTYLAACRCTPPVYLFLLVAGSHTNEAYSNVGLVAICFDRSGAVGGVTSEEGKSAIGFLCNGIHMVVP